MKYSDILVMGLDKYHREAAVMCFYLMLLSVVSFMYHYFLMYL